MAARLLAAPFVLLLSLGLSAVSCAQEKSASPAPESKAATPKGKAIAKDPKGEAAKADTKTEKATFGGGCFWCLEAAYETIPGVKSVVSGYAGGFVRNPSYEMVSTGETGHAEVVQIEYDPEVVSYEKLLEVFWHIHDPTTPNQQGPDFGTQYRSIILYQTQAQKDAALKSYRKLTADGAFASPIVTKLEPLKAFYPADKHHQDYYRKNKRAAYCQTYIVPKLRKLQKLKLDEGAAAKK